MKSSTVGAVWDDARCAPLPACQRQVPTRLHDRADAGYGGGFGAVALRALTAICGLDRGPERLRTLCPPDLALVRQARGHGMRVIAQNRHAVLRASIVAMVTMVILLLTSGQNALATCTFHGQSDATFVLPDTITVSRTANVGAILYRSPHLQTQPAIPRDCDTQGSLVMRGYLAPMQVIPGMSDVYQTNIPGIGVKVFEASSDPEDFVTLEANVWKTSGAYSADSRGPVSRKFQVEWIFTGLVSPGTLSLPSPLAGTYSSDPDSHSGLANQGLFARLLTSGTTRIIARGCSVDNKDIAVRLPTINSSSGVGDTAESVSLNIALTCYPSTKLAYQIDGSLPPGMATSLKVLANRTDTGDVTGLGVQILADGSTAPLILDHTLSATFVTTTSDDLPVPIPVPFVAGYYRSSATMTTADVWARATLTMNYQ